MNLKKFHQQISENLPQLLNLADNLGCGLRFIGGVSRDFLISNVLVDDIDIEVFKRDEEFETFWNNLKQAVSKLDPNYKTLEYNIIRFSLGNDGQKQEIEFTPVREEKFDDSLGHKNFEGIFHNYLSASLSFKRRDLTINAISFTYENREFTLEDPFDGIEHLNQKQADICDENQFFKDPVRALRLFRFCVNYSLDPMIDLSKLSVKNLSGYYFFYEAKKVVNLDKFFSYRTACDSWDEYLRMIGISNKRSHCFTPKNLPIDLEIAFNFDVGEAYSIFSQLSKRNQKQLHHLLKLRGVKDDFESLLELEDQYIDHHPFFTLKKQYENFEIDLSHVEPKERKTYKKYKFLEGLK